MLPAYIYKFKTRALNVYGYSDWSEELDVGVSSFPAQPAALVKLAAETGPTYITLQWAKSLDTQLPVLGYQIWMDDGDDGDYSIVYEGLNYPNVLKHMVTGL